VGNGFLPSFPSERGCDVQLLNVFRGSGVGILEKAAVREDSRRAHVASVREAEEKDPRLKLRNLIRVRERLVERNLPPSDRRRRLLSINLKISRVELVVKQLDLWEAIDGREEVMVLNCISCGGKHVAKGFRRDPRSQLAHIRIECGSCGFVTDARDMAADRQG